jgi:starch synthase
VHVLMVAAENDALPGGKVGGVGDVVRDLPPALAELGCRVSVLSPAYGLLGDLPGAHRVRELDVPFRGSGHAVGLYQVHTSAADAAVRHYVLDHELFAACGRGVIYCDDGPERPYATDAGKFALFCAAVAEAFVADGFGAVDVVHLHDWHTALVLLLGRQHPRYATLGGARTVFTIHNLGLQGVRPLAGDPSSLREWFPGLRVDPALVSDPRWPDCVNPMAVGIRLADVVNTVSPSYAQEILEPSAAESAGFHGGEGLETDLRAMHEHGRLFGILNGCSYRDERPPVPGDWPELLTLMRAECLRLAGSTSPLASALFVAHARLAAMRPQRPATVLTSVGRVTAQKLGLLRTADGSGRPALDSILDALGEDGLYVILGSGDADLEQFLVSVMARRAELLFLRGYSAPLAPGLYSQGDLYLMPSAYEPCGISQMLAMRAGQPCLVHAVGGLKDTVHDGRDGFSFDGASATEQATSMGAALVRALDLRARKPKRFQSLRKAAEAARFQWSDSAARYLDLLYRGGPSKAPARPGPGSGA